MCVRHRKKRTRGERNMWPNAKETAYCWGLLAGRRSGFDLFCLAWPGTDTSPAPDTIDHTVREREAERGRWGEVG